MTDQKIAYRYVGPGWFPGVPPIDLTVEAFANLDVLAQLDVQAGTLYHAVDAPALSTLKKDELVALAESRGIDATGTMAEIIERIENEEVGK